MPATEAIEHDELLLGRFRVLEKIGSGGMGTVHRAFDERLQRQVAVKQVHAGEPDRVMREAQAAARLNHPGIVTLYELGERDGEALLVSELVEGGTLAELSASGALSDREIAELGSGLCDALEHAHRRGVIHRDLKPSNILVRRDEALGRRAKLLDFGIARVSDTRTLTEDGQVVGTLAYMAPEQADGQGAEPASDVYSLALTLYECWAGRNPVAADTPAETARRIGSPLPGLASFRPELPARLCEPLDAALDPDPELRPAPRELAEALEGALEELSEDSVIARPVGLSRTDSGGWAPALAPAVLAVILATLAWPLDLPGLAVVVAVLGTPVALLSRPAPRSVLACLAAPLGALGLQPLFAAAAGALGRSALERGTLAALGWTSALCLAFATGSGAMLGLGESAAEGWSGSARAAIDGILSAALAPEALLGALAMALAGVAMGWILSTRHLSLALLGALVWTAGLEGLLATVGDGGLAGRPLILASAALLAVFVAFARRDGAMRPAAPALPASPNGQPGHGWSGRLA